MSENNALATLGGGCFWCLEAVFEEMQGVTIVVSGYANGDTENPTYERVCSGKTGYVEVVQVSFDPSIVSYRELLEVFFAIHDPTTLNRQGADVGTQYRSGIYYHSEEQKATAEHVIDELTEANIFGNPIVTEVTPLANFYAAEDYHQGYYRNHPGQGYCQVVISPKLAKFRQKFTNKQKAGR